MIEWADHIPSIVDNTLPLAARYGLSAIDTLPIAAALNLPCDEFITAERSTSPLLRVQELPVLTIHGQ
jgi:predicted nucleic acid-binding protein